MNKYKTTINGLETTLLLNDADAEAMGLKASDDDKPAPKPAKAAKAPANKSRTPANKSAEGDA